MSNRKLQFQRDWLEAKGLVKGFGVNDANYQTSPMINGKTLMCPAYMAWLNMLTRVYCEKSLKKHPAYIGCAVCDEWRSFMSFRSWWLENHVEGWQLDKDLLSDSRVYSPDTCVYVHRWLNNFITRKASGKGSLPVGVCLENFTKKFKAQCCAGKYGDYKNLWRFDTPEAAHSAWRERKLSIALIAKPDMDAIDARIYPRVIKLINGAGL